MRRTKSDGRYADSSSKLAKCAEPAVVSKRELHRALESWIACLTQHDAKGTLCWSGPPLREPHAGSGTVNPRTPGSMSPLARRRLLPALGASPPAALCFAAAPAGGDAGGAILSFTCELSFEAKLREESLASLSTRVIWSLLPDPCESRWFAPGAPRDPRAIPRALPLAEVRRGRPAAGRRVHGREQRGIDRLVPIGNL